MSDLFDTIDDRGPETAIRPRDPNADRRSHKRLTRQSEEILAMLRRGRQTNGALAGVTSRYGARIYDIRHHFRDSGQSLEIRIVGQNHATGVVWYALFEDGREVGANFTN